MGRRAAFGAVIAQALAAAAVIGGPALAYLVHPLTRARSRARWIRVAPLEEVSRRRPSALPVIGDSTDAWTRFEAERLGTVLLRRSPEGVVIAMSAECPHLGCTVRMTDNAETPFACPCHRSAFDAEGRVKFGPSPRALDRLDARVVDGFVEVRFVRYRTQVSEKVELG